MLTTWSAAIDTTPRVSLLHSQVPAGVLAAGDEPVRLSWQVEAADPSSTQTAYEVQVARDPAFADVHATSGVVVSSDQIAIPAPGAPLTSREVRYCRVRLRIDDAWTPWSESLRIEAGLLRPQDWLARAITLPGDPGSDTQAPCPLLRREFDLGGSVRSARLYATALGVYRLTINGQAVSDDLLAPGWTPYQQRLLADTYDVTGLLASGPNVLAGVIGDGWYRGRLGWDPDGQRAHYGSRIALIAQLEVILEDGTSLIIGTDAQWVAATGEVRSADLYDGSVHDLRERRVGWDLPGYDDGDWSPVECIPYDAHAIQPRVAPPVRVAAVLPVVRREAGDTIILDGGQNIAGYVRLRVRGRPGDQVVVRHAEVLEPDGSLHVRSLRTARSTDTYTLADDGEETLEPLFTFHGFQYAEIRTVAELVDAEFVAISSAWTDRSEFECAEPALNRLHENVAWSLRDNFVSLPTDCPQRDERLGWTGDAQVFAATAATMFCSEALWASWLRDLDLEQHDELGVPSVVPDVVLTGEPRYGRAGWGDAATIVPWSVYESYGDLAVLRRQFSSMRRWVSSLESRRGSDGLLGVEMQFGDWLDPNAPIERPWEALTNSTFLANAFFSHSARLLAKAAAILDEPAIAERAETLAGEVAAETWKRWKHDAVTTQTGCAVALQFGLPPADQRRVVAATLARLVAAAGGHVATGFLGTPLVLPALSSEDFYDAAYLMLLCRTNPSWLYQVETGATTIWERWDAIRPDGSIHPGDMRSLPQSVDAEVTESHMLSFNHYAYGAVMDWVYRHVAGIAPAQAGYRSVTFAPVPAAGIDWARASVDTPYGPVRIDWRVDERATMEATVELPFGATGSFVAPATPTSLLTLDGKRAPSLVATLGPGRHQLVVTSCRVARP